MRKFVYDMDCVRYFEVCKVVFVLIYEFVFEICVFWFFRNDKCNGDFVEYWVFLVNNGVFFDKICESDYRFDFWSCDIFSVDF